MNSRQIQEELNKSELLLTKSERFAYLNSKKKLSTYLILLIILGGFGAHYFYLEKNVCGVLSLLFCWTLLPALFALLGLFTCRRDVNLYNLKILGKDVRD